MTAETVTDTASLNGTAPAAADEPCENCASGGERIMAILAAGFGIFILLMAVDMFTGGRVTGLIREQVGQ